MSNLKTQQAVYIATLYTDDPRSHYERTDVVCRACGDTRQVALNGLIDMAAKTEITVMPLESQHKTCVEVDLLLGHDPETLRGYVTFEEITFYTTSE